MRSIQPIPFPYLSLLCFVPTDPPNKDFASKLMELKIVPGAEPFFIPGGKIGCLCLHGLSASPQEVAWLGQFLAQRGMTVYGPRLHGHGADPDLMRRVRWQDWYLSALDGYHLLKQNCDHVFALGFSMGALLALRLAATEDVAGVVAMAPPLRLTANAVWRIHLLRYIQPVISRSERGDRIDLRVREIQAQRGEKITGRVAYYVQHSVGVSELVKLQAEVAATLPQIHAPVLLVASERDDTAPPFNLDLIQARLTDSPKIESLRLKDSEHILPNDIEMDQLFAAVAKFIEGVNTQPG